MTHMYYTLIHFIMIYHLSYAFIEDSTWEVGLLHQSQADCTRAIVSKYFPNGTVIYSVSVNPNLTSTTTTVDLNKRILEQLHMRLNWPILTKYSVANHNAWNVHLELASGYILLINALEDAMENILFLKELPTWNPHAHFIVLLMETAEYVEDLVVQMMHELWDLYIINAIVLTLDENQRNSFKIYTWFPYAKGSCGQDLVDVTYLDTCRNGKFVLGRNLFPDKVPVNMNGCPIKVIAVVWPPFIINPPDYEIEDDVDIPLTNGYEILMMQTLERHFNCKFIYRSFSEPENWGNVFPNGTVTGMFQYLLERKADIGIGATFPKPSIRDNFDYSLQYLQDQYVLVYPRAGLAPAWQNFLTILSPSTFVACIVVYISLSMAFYWTAQEAEEPYIFKTPVGAFLSILSLALMNFIGVQPKLCRLRSLYILWAYFNINLNAVFQSGLSRSYTYPLRSYQVKTEREIVLGKYTVGGTDAITMIYGNSDDYISKYIMSHYKNLPAMDALEFIAFEKNMTTIISRHYLSYVPKYLKNKIFVPSTNIISLPIEMLFVKGFPYGANFDAVISYCLAAGLFERWKSLVRGSMQRNETDEKEMDERTKNIEITLSEASGAFALLGLGYILATVAFLYELVKYRQRRCQRCLRRMTYRKRKLKTERPFSFVL